MIAIYCIAITRGSMTDDSSTGTITIRTSPEIISALGKLAESMDRPRNWVAEAAIRSYLETQSWQVEGIKEALGSLDRGEGIVHGDIVSELDRLIGSHEK